MNLNSAVYLDTFGTDANHCLSLRKTAQVCKIFRLEKCIHGNKSIFFKEHKIVF